jgi:hypothetical protein
MIGFLGRPMHRWWAATDILLIAGLSGCPLEF